MERIILMAIKQFYMLPIWFYKIVSYANDDKRTVEERYSMLSKAVIRVAKTGGISIKCTGLENLPKEMGYILFPNHQGLCDPLLLLSTHKRPFSVIMKKETDKIYFLRKFRQLLYGQLMDREDVRQSMKVIQQMSKEVKEGKNYVIFPEGTRSKHPNKTGEFKGGSFKSATKARCPIVPVVVIDSYKAFDIHSVKKFEAQIHYLEPLYYEEYKDMKTVEIATMVKERIDNKIKELGKWDEEKSK